jgi:bacterioferritin-associated ferredoxin
MIVCICNGLNDRDIKDICNSCKTKQEFTDCMKQKMSERSCRTCYHQLVESFEREKK